MICSRWMVIVIFCLAAAVPPAQPATAPIFEAFPGPGSSGGNTSGGGLAAATLLTLPDAASTWTAAAPPAFLPDDPPRRFAVSFLTMLVPAAAGGGGAPDSGGGGSSSGGSGGETTGADGLLLGNAVSDVAGFRVTVDAVTGAVRARFASQFTVRSVVSGAGCLAAGGGSRSETWVLMIYDSNHLAIFLNGTAVASGRYFRELLSTKPLAPIKSAPGPLAPAAIRAVQFFVFEGTDVSAEKLAERHQVSAGLTTLHPSIASTCRLKDSGGPGNATTIGLAVGLTVLALVLAAAATFFVFARKKRQSTETPTVAMSQVAVPCPVPQNSEIPQPSQGAPVSQPLHQNLPAIRHVDQVASGESLCTICQVNRPCVLLLPCRHVPMCGECSTGAQRQVPFRCPVCRAAVEQTTVVFVT